MNHNYKKKNFEKKIDERIVEFIQKCALNPTKKSNFLYSSKFF